LEDDLSLFPRKRGRPRGPNKVAVKIWVLPETAKTLRARAFKLSLPLGEVLDKLLAKFKPENKNKTNEEKHISTAKVSEENRPPEPGRTVGSDEGA
jgi:hypothetical protein